MSKTMSLLSLTSDQVKQFLPLHSWTPVFIIPGSKSKNDGIYKITTNTNYLKMCQDIHKMAMLSHAFLKVQRFKMFELVAVELEGIWCRGRMLSYNEYLTNNTTIMMIDTGFLIDRPLNVLYSIPEDLTYDPLCIAIKSVNDIPTSRNFYVKPLLSKSELHKGYVLVELRNCNEEISYSCIDNNDPNLTEVQYNHVSSSDQILDSKINEMPISKIYKGSTNWKSNEKANSNQLLNSLSEELICNLGNKPMCSTKDNSNEFQVHASLDKSNLKEYTRFVFSNVLQEVFQSKKGNVFQNIHDFGANLLTPLTFNVSFKMDHKRLALIKPVNKNIEIIPDKKKPMSINFSSDVLNLPVIESENLNKINCEKKSGNQLNVLNIPNKSIVEFCYGSNVDFVYVNFVEQMNKFNVTLKMFYSFYHNDNKINKENPARGELVAAFLPIYKEIQRALILNRNTTNSKLYLCYFVDIGCKHYIYSKYIYELPEGVKQVPYLAHRVGLKGMKPLNNTSKLNYLKNYFKKLYRKHLTMYYDENDKDGLNKVVLLKCDDNVDICEEINNFLNDSSNVKDNVTTVQKKNSYSVYCGSVLKCGSLVVIAHFESIKNLYVRLLSDEHINSFNTLMKKMEDYFCNMSGVKVRRNPKVGEKLGVRSSMNIILRGLIYEKVNNNCFMVFYMDFGNIECVEGKNLLELPYELRCVPPTVIKIGINLTIPIVALPEQITNYFNMLISSSTPLFVVFVDKNDSHGCNEVLLTKDGVDLCQDINLYCTSVKV